MCRLLFTFTPLLKDRRQAVTNLPIIVDARDETIKVKQVERGAESVTQGCQPGRLQVLQLTHEGGVVLLPACLKYTRRAVKRTETGPLPQIEDVYMCARRGKLSFLLTI